MLTSDPLVASAESVDAAKTYLRLDGDEDDAVIASLVVSATAQAESFTNSVQVARIFAETVEGGGTWTNLSAWPVVAVTSVATLDGVPLVIGSYETDIRTDGVGRVRLTGLVTGAGAGVGAQRVRVSYQAGRAASWTAIAEPVRHGIVRLVAHHYETRDRSDGGGLPAAVAVLWRGARRMVLS